MTSSNSRRARRERKEVQRRRQARQRAGRATRSNQAAAQTSRVSAVVRGRRHAAAYVMWVLAALLGVALFLVYTDVIGLFSPDAANVLFGLPAVFLAVGGGIVYGE